MLKMLAVILAITTISGCAQKRWHSYGKTQQQFYQENAQCLAMSGSGASSQIIQGNSSFANGYNQMGAMMAQSNKTNIYQQCMMGNGWWLE